MQTFEVGKSYYCRSLANHESIFEITIYSRTAKTVQVGVRKSLRIKVIDDCETVSPCGRYSMAPTIWANHEKKSFGVFE